MDTINGLPAHPLLVHLAVVAIPLAAVVGIVAVVWPRARQWLRWGAPATALVAVVVTPLTTSAGESLEHSIPKTPQLETHTHLGDEMIYWVAPLFVAMVIFWALTDAFTDRWASAVPATVRRVLTYVFGAAVLILAIGAIIWVYRVGDSGATSVWLG